MTIVRYRPDPNNPVELTPEEEAFQASLTDEEIERLAREDPDNPPSTEEELARGVAARDVRLTREKTGFSQSQFAKRYRINLARLRDIEQGRTMPDSAFLAYIRVINREPEAVDRALNAA
jgi:putative transcriptional regulator